MITGLTVFFVSLLLIAISVYLVLTPKQSRQVRCWFIPSPPKTTYRRNNRDKDTGRYL